MFNKAFLAACIFAALSACDRPQKPVSAAPATPHAAPSTSGPKAILVAPEHFDRVRAEQFEKEEDRLRRRSRSN